MKAQEIFYDEDFYKNLYRTSLPSARKIVPIIMKLVQPESVIDIGCGVGAWLSVFRENGVKDVLGIDGDYVDEKLLLISKENFLRQDLTKELRINRRFDLVVSLEVAEHLPELLAKSFIRSLSNLGSIVLFSAAVPFQGGVHHINEQWPDYWVEHFESYGYVPVDCIRRKIWNDREVAWWYAQNILLFVRKDILCKFSQLQNEFNSTEINRLAMIHPVLWKCKINMLSNRIWQERVLKILKKPFRENCQKLLSKIFRL